LFWGAKCGAGGEFCSVPSVGDLLGDAGEDSIQQSGLSEVQQAGLCRGDSQAGINGAEEQAEIQVDAAWDFGDLSAFDKSFGAAADAIPLEDLSAGQYVAPVTGARAKPAFAAAAEVEVIGSICGEAPGIRQLFQCVLCSRADFGSVACGGRGDLSYGVVSGD